MGEGTLSLWVTEGLRQSAQSPPSVRAAPSPVASSPAEAAKCSTFAAPPSTSTFAGAVALLSAGAIVLVSAGVVVVVCSVAGGVAVLLVMMTIAIFNDVTRLLG